MQPAHLCSTDRTQRSLRILAANLPTILSFGVYFKGFRVAK